MLGLDGSSARPERDEGKRERQAAYRRATPFPADPNCLDALSAAMEKSPAHELCRIAFNRPADSAAMKDQTNPIVIDTTILR